MQAITMISTNKKKKEMRKIILIFFLLLILIISCKDAVRENKNSLNSVTETVVPELQSILDSANIEGAILIYDKKENTYYSNNFQESKEDYLPASTFKIPNSIIGLELGILENEHTVFKWDSLDRFLPVWEQDLPLKDAFQTSCVPCYQELARTIGLKNMKEYIEKLKFGEMYVTEETIDNFWLIGPSKINPFQQIDFLKRLNEEELLISKSTRETVRSILKIETMGNCTLSGKTGLAINGEKDVGWFVGFINKKKSVYYFATKISPKADDMPRSEFNPLRQEVTVKALRKMNIIE